jgi:hypothetical protein
MVCGHLLTWLSIFLKESQYLSLWRGISEIETPLPTLAYLGEEPLASHLKTELRELCRGEFHQAIPKKA